jgi:hypothetical protein
MVCVNHLDKSGNHSGRSASGSVEVVGFSSALCYLPIRTYRALPHRSRDRARLCSQNLSSFALGDYDALEKIK